MIQIKHKVTGLVLLEVDSDTLVGADLSWVDIRAAELKGVNLSGTDLHRASLCVANLCGADLEGANLEGANLCGANLNGASLYRANLEGANLEGASLNGASLEEANLKGAILTGTILDPSNPTNRGVLNGVAHKFEKDGEFLTGYRTKKSIHVGEQVYEVGQDYEAPWFSTGGVPCHPGLYVCPSVENVWYHDVGRDIPLVKVRFKEEDLHQAGDKYRVRKFAVVEEVEGIGSSSEIT